MFFDIMINKKYLYNSELEYTTINLEGWQSWSNAQILKICGRLNVPWVRIPYLPLK